LTLELVSFCVDLSLNTNLLLLAVLRMEPRSRYMLGKRLPLSYTPAPVFNLDLWQNCRTAALSTLCVCGSTCLQFWQTVFTVITFYSENYYQEIT
jgi:hypothetical protein